MNLYPKAFIVTILLTSIFNSSYAVCPKPLQQANTGTTALFYSCPQVPESVILFDKTIDLTRFDRHERMDRELLAFAYMHSTSIQTIKRANRYFPIVEPILKEYGIPDDFKYLMAIESNCSPLARSHAGASGLWQFMQSTGREYGLEVNKNIDERYHVEKSTIAACKYLKAAYTKYNDWIAVAAAYNGGQARIAGQMSKQQVDETLDLYLVEETARYVYRIMAAKIMLSNPSAFGFRLKASDLYMPIGARSRLTALACPPPLPRKSSPTQLPWRAIPQATSVLPVR